MAETDHAARIAERLMELKPKRRRRSVNALLLGMERLFKQTRSTDDEGAEPGRSSEHGASETPGDDLTPFRGLEDDDAPDGDDDEDDTAAFERALAAGEIDDPFAAEGSPELTAYTEAFGELEDVLDGDLDHAVCLQVGQALVALRTFLQCSGHSTEPLDELEEDLEDPQPS